MNRKLHNSLMAVVSSSALLDPRISSQTNRQMPADTNPSRIRVSTTSPKISPPLTRQCYLSRDIRFCLDYGSCT